MTRNQLRRKVFPASTLGAIVSRMEIGIIFGSIFFILLFPMAWPAYNTQPLMDTKFLGKIDFLFVFITGCVIIGLLFGSTFGRGMPPALILWRFFPLNQSTIDLYKEKRKKELMEVREQNERQAERTKKQETRIDAELSALEKLSIENT